MEQKAIRLKLVLDELGLPHKFNSVSERILLQKAVYLAQAAGVPLGYDYSWYRYGPYCTELADTYYSLNRSCDLDEVNEYGLRDETKARLAKVKELMASAPDESDMKNWLETVASLQFLYKEMNMSDEKVAGMMMRDKPYLSKYVDQAKSALKGCGLLNA